MRARLLALLLLLPVAAGASTPEDEEAERRTLCRDYAAREGYRYAVWANALRANLTSDGRAVFPRYLQAMAAFRADNPAEGVRLLGVVMGSPTVTDADWTAQEAADDLRFYVMHCDPDWKLGVPRPHPGFEDDVYTGVFPERRALPRPPSR